MKGENQVVLTRFGRRVYLWWMHRSIRFIRLVGGFEVICSNKEGAAGTGMSLCAISGGCFF